MKNKVVSKITKILMIAIVIIIGLPILSGMIIGTMIGIRKNAIESKWEQNVKEPQQKLATELGIKIQDYPYPWDFPMGYFIKVLKPGMTYKDIHSIIRGYIDVSNCGGVTEIYDYFGTTPEDRLRFYVHYNKSGEYIEMQEENPAEGDILSDGCNQGLLGQ